MGVRWPSHKIVDFERAVRISREMKNKGKTIVFTNGCFDILHKGHVKLLFTAKSFGDVLFVGMNTDESVRKIKGDDRPVIPFEQRAFVLAGLEAVDWVVPFEDETPLELIKAIEPDILVKGADWPEDKIVGADIVKARGGKVIRVELEEGISTTAIINRIRGVAR